MAFNEVVYRYNHTQSNTKQDEKKIIYVLKNERFSMSKIDRLGRREFLKQICMGAAITSLTGLSCAVNPETPHEDKRPNIVFLFSDDQRFDALGCMGNKYIKTPHLDKIGNEGIIFDNHYNNTSICMPSRAIVMTGMHEYKTGCGFQHGPLDRKLFDLSYPVQLRKAGYYTGFAGKFGFGIVDGLGSEGIWHKEDGMPKDDFDFWAGWSGQGKYKSAENGYIAKFKDKYPHTTRALGAAGQDFIKEAKKSGKPFCLSVSFKAPHSPVSPDKEFDDLYDAVEFPKPANYGPEAGEHLCHQAKSSRQVRLFKGWSEEKYQERLSKYYRQIYAIDVAVGMIREEIKAQGVVDNTVIIFMTDNGYSTGSHGFGGKVLPYEEAARSPLLMYDPRMPVSKRGKRCAALTGSIDMAPTMLELASVSIPGKMDGESLVALMENPDSKVRDDMLFTQVWGPLSNHSLTVITPEYKYIYWMYGDEGMTPCEELFDMKTDRLEMNNLAGDPKHTTGFDRMRRLYDQYVEQWKKDCYPLLQS